jgi:hypothetical protein
LSRLLLAVAALLAVTGCAAADGGSPGVSTGSGSASATPSTAASPTPDPVNTRSTNPRLRKELLAMLAADQADRSSSEETGVGGDQARTERLREIVAEHGWPTQTLVGDDGATAAWAIAQHSDLDPEFQREMLQLMGATAAIGEADRGELAYLTDRVAANAGQPQTYGTQMGCGADGKPQLAPLAEPDRVDALRAAAGLSTLEDYLAELATICAQSQ